MSIDTLTVTRVVEFQGITISVPDTDQVSIDFRQEDGDTESLVWQQIDKILRSSLEQSGFPQPSVPLGRTHPLPPERVKKAVVVAPGIMVWEDEYKERYEGIDLQRFRQQMPPDLFRAFVRYIGSIPGHPDLDVNELVNIPE